VNSSSRQFALHETDIASDSETKELASVVHALREQACTLGLGISALQYPLESDGERQHYISVLEAVIDDMSREFKRLDQCLTEARYKQTPRQPLNLVRRRIKRRIGS
jgi:hypothetical protein